MSDRLRRFTGALVDVVTLGLAVYAQQQPELPTRAALLNTVVRGATRVSQLSWRLARWAERRYREEVDA